MVTIKVSEGSEFESRCVRIFFNYHYDITDDILYDSGVLRQTFLHL